MPLSDAAPTPPGHTLAMIFVAPMAAALEQRGVDVRAILEQVGVDPACLQAAGTRIPLNKVEQIWDLAFEATDEALAIDMARRLHPGSLGALSFGLFSSVTLRDATERFRRDIHMLSNAASGLCEVVGDEFHVLAEAPPGLQISAVRQIYLSAVMVVLWRTLSGRAVTPLRVSFQGVGPPRSPEIARRLEKFFGCPIEYETAHHRIVLALGEAQRILPAANAELARLGEEVVDEYLVDGAQGPIAPRVRMEVIGLLASGDFGKDKVARRLGLGARTLQRRLDAEGVTFRELVDATRRGLAERYVREGRLPIKEIAYMLGFSELSNFTRAFRQWFGVPPRAFREAARRAD